ncbi:MAG: HAD-IC family P-type ATPase [bacterium]
MEKILWHNLAVTKVAEILRTDIEYGLSEEKIAERQKEFGKNKLEEEKPLSSFRMFLEQLRSPLIYILLIAGMATLIFKEYTDAIVIFGAVFLNSVIGYFQEKKASQTLKELKKIIQQHAQVIREGNTKIINSEELVYGDVFILNSGDKIPADGRIIEAYDLKINEMALTGEWLSAKKHIGVLDEKVPLADRDNMVYMGTVIEEGNAKVIATSTGGRTEIGKIAEIVGETKERETPLQKKLSHFSKIIGIVIAVVCFFIFIQGMFTLTDLEPMDRFEKMFTTAIAVAVAAIPEGLPVAMTVILALGMQRILKKKGLVRNLLAAETLGSTSVIATDKTGTLTQGKIRVTDFITPQKLFGKKNKDKTLVFKIAALCNKAFVENPEASPQEWKISGQLTDRALLSFGLAAGFGKKELSKEMPELDEIPFDNKKRMSATLVKSSAKENFLFVVGAPEEILELCQLKEEEKEIWKKEIEKIASLGFRTLAFAVKKTSKSDVNEKDLVDLEFIALLELSDPLRKEVKSALRICREAGMRPIIITGDHKLTAKAIAQQLEFKVEEENIIEGKELDEMSDKEFSDRVKSIEIYARVEPRHKIKIIQAWQDRGEVVAMTGDGINDAPALKRADIGIALGSGTDVAKETSDLILLSNSFNVIVAAVEEGRGIIDNTRKVITYLLSGSFTEIILIGAALLLRLDLPVIAVQILWINLIEGGPLGLSLAFEPKEKDLMRRKPQGHDTPLLTKEMKTLIFTISIIGNILLLGLFLWLYKYSGYEIEHIRSIIFAGLTIDAFFYLFSCKSLRKNLWHINLFSNKFLILSWLFGFITLLAALYLPVLQTLLQTVPLNLFDWQLLSVLALLNIILIESTKWYFITKKDLN